MLRITFAAAFIASVATSLSHADTNWEQTIGQYSNVTIIGGAGAVDSGGSNEWNNADGLPATQAELSEPHSAMADIHGNVFIADRNANAVRKITPDGIITTVLGTGLVGDGPDGPALQCAISGPQNAYILPDGTLYVLEVGNKKVRRVDRDGNTTTVFTDPGGVLRGLWVRRDAQLIYYCGFNSLRRWTPANGTSPGEVMATGFTEFGNIDVNVDGAVFVTDRGASLVYRVPANASNIVVNPSFAVAGTGGNLNSGREKDGFPALSTGIVGVRGIAFHPLGGYFLGTHKGGDIWYVDTDGIIHLVVEGNDTSASAPGSIAVPTPPGSIVMAEARSVSVTLDGHLLIACNDAGFIRRVTNIVPKPAAPLLEPSAWIPAQGFRLQWQSAPNDWHLIERSTNMTSWSFANASLGSIGGGPVQWTDSSSLTAPRNFYRLRAFRAWPN